ncbi:MAG TPA: TIGR03435 family protein [Edaphobacter sp.]
MERWKQGRWRGVCVVWARSGVGLLRWMALWFATCSGGAAQSPQAAKLEFDVASVRQNKSDNRPSSTFSLDNGNVYSTVDKGDVFTPRGSYFAATNQPLWHYIAFAYNLSGTEELALRFNYFAGLSSKAPIWVTGGFDVSADRFDIAARSDGRPTKDQMRLMMQALLADRFKLMVHRETRQAPVFALVLTKPRQTGAELVPHPPSDTCAVEPTVEADDSPSNVPARSSALGELPRVCRVIAHLPTSAIGHIRFGGRGVMLSLLASSLPTMTGMAMIPRPVIDETGLNGAFDFTLDWVSEFNAPSDASGPNFREALKEQLGLRLEPQQGPVDILVIDRVEHPSAN